MKLEINKFGRGLIVSFLLGAAVAVISLIYFVPPFVNLVVTCTQGGRFD